MAAPPVLARATHVSSTSDSTSYTPTLATMTAGKSGLAVVSADGNPSLNAWPDGWVPVGYSVNGTTVSAFLLWKARLDGTETSLALTFSSAQQYSCISECVDAGDFPQIAVAASNGSSTNSNPPNNAWGSSQDALIIATRSGDNTVVATVAPSGYSDLQSRAAGGTSGASTNTAEKSVTAASSEDPGTFTSSSEQWACFTIAIWATTQTEFTRADRNLAVTASSDNLTISSAVWSVDPNGQGARTNIGHKTGKRVVAFTPEIGSDSGTSEANAYLRIMLSSSFGRLLLIGNDDPGTVTWRNSNANNGAGELRYSDTTGTHTYLSTQKLISGSKAYIAVDIDAMLAWIRPYSSAYWNGDPTADPEAGVGGQDISDISGDTLFFMGGMEENDDLTIDGDATSHGLTTFQTWNDVSTTTSGSASVTDSADSASAAGTLKIKAAAAATDTADTVAATGGLVIDASAGLTDSDDTVSASGQAALTAISAAAAIIEADDTVTATGQLGPISAAAALTDSNDAVAATGVSLLQASSAWTEAADSVAATGALKISGTASCADSDDAAASTARLPIQATAALIDDDDVAAATALLGIRAVVSASDSDDSAAGAAALRIMAVAALAEGDDTASSAGQLPIGGAFNGADADDIVAATGAVRIAASAAVTEDDDQVSAYSGVIVTTAAVADLVDSADVATAAARLIIAGVAAAADSDDRCVSAGALTAKAAAAANDTPDTCDAAARTVLSAAATIYEDSDIAQAVGWLVIRGGADITDSDDLAVAVGKKTMRGALDVTEDDDVAASTATLPIRAGAAAADSPETLVAIAGQRQAGGRAFRIFFR